MSPSELLNTYKTIALPLSYQLEMAIISVNG